MIFLEKNGRFGNFLFQFFVAKCIQKKTKNKIFVFSKKENIYSFNSKKNIDSIVKGYTTLPKFSKFLNLWKKKFLYVNDSNYKDILNSNYLIKNKIIYIDGFFQDISIIDSNRDLLSEIIKPEENIYKNHFLDEDLTIHIRHLHHELGTLDTNPNHQDQPDLNYYVNIINQHKPKIIKIICSSEKNKILIKIKEIYKDIVFHESKDDIYDFFNIMASNNLILSNSSFSFWASILSEAKNIYVPDIGIIKKIFSKKELNFKNNFIYE